MKWIIVTLLWLLAIAVALLVLVRWWRGRNILLRGRWSPRLLRMVAVVLVVLGAGRDEARPAPAPGTDDTKGKKQPDEALPPAVTQQTIEKWLSFQQGTGEWARVKQGYVKVSASPGQPDDQTLQVVQTSARRLFPEKFAELFLADLDAAATGKPAPAARGGDLLAALDELEKVGCFDHWTAALLWRKTARLTGTEPRELVHLYARLHRHARLTNTLIAARSQVRPLFENGGAWRSKGGRAFGHEVVVEYNPKQQAAVMLKIAPKIYPQSDPGTWQRDGFTLMTVAKDSAPVTWIRAGQGRVPVDNPALTFGRLDLIETLPGEKPALLEHAWLGELRLPAGRVVSVWDLPAHLSGDGKVKVKQAVADALAGNASAANRLERALPLAHAALREELAKSPGAKGAARLRLILSTFDDAVMPAADGLPLEDLTPRRVLGRVRD